MVAGAATSQRTAAVPAKPPSAARLFLSDKIKGREDRVVEPAALYLFSVSRLLSSVLVFSDTGVPRS